MGFDPAQFLAVTLNGLTQAALYFIVASGFTLIFGLMRTVNMAHGALYLFGAYLGYVLSREVFPDLAGAQVARDIGWPVALLSAFLTMAIVGLLMQRFLLGWMPGQDLRQALATIALAIIIADLLLARFGGITYQFSPPGAISGSTPLPIVREYSTFRLFMIVAAVAIGIALWLLLERTRLGMVIRAGIDDREMLSALGVNVPRTFLVVFALGAGLAGLAGVMGGTALSISPGEDTRYLLSSLVVVIVGGMGSLGGAALGALLVGMTEQYGLFYSPLYEPILLFGLMAAVLALRPQGLLGRPA